MDYLKIKSESYRFYHNLLDGKMSKLDIINAIEDIADSNLVKVKALKDDLEMYLGRDLYSPFLEHPETLIKLTEETESDVSQEEKFLKIKWGNKEICKIKLPESRGKDGQIITPAAESEVLKDDKYIPVCKVINFLKEKIDKVENGVLEKNSQDPGENSVTNKESPTRQLINETFEGLDNNKGWEYAFRSKSDYNSFVNLLTSFFEFKEYLLPEQVIQLKRGCKTRLAATLGRIHSDLSNNNTLKNDTKFFEIIKTLNHFKNLTTNQLYKDLSRFGKG